ncbi:MAG: CDP-glucose 4,6-dehydratase, partial [Bacteroidota bacterium]
KAVRPWQHVVEPLAGYLEVGMRLSENPIKYSGAWNFGPESKDCISVGEVVRKSVDIWGKGTFQFLGNYNGPHEAKLLMLDINKSIYELNWQPRFDVSKALKQTISWYKDYYLDKNTATPNILNTIKDYLNEK